MSVETKDAGNKQRAFAAGRALARWFPGLLLVAAALACIGSPFLAIYQARQPFAGFVVEPTMVVSSLHRSSWTGHAAGLVHMRRVVAADGNELSNPKDLNAYLRSLPLGTPVQYTVASQEGQQILLEEVVPTTLLPTTDVVLLFWLPYFVALAYLASGIWVYLARRRQPQGQACTVFCSSAALSLSLLFNGLLGHHFNRLWIAALPLSAAAAIHLALVFPEPLPFLRRSPGSAWLAYLPAAVLVLWEQSVHTSSSRPWAYMSAWKQSYLLITVAAIVLLGSLLYIRGFGSSVRTRQQARSVLFGGLISFVPTAIWFGLAAFGFDVSPYLLIIFLPLAIFPFTLAYAIAREQLLDVDRVVSRGLANSLLVVLVAGLYLVIVGLIGWLAPGLLRADDHLALAFLIILAALLVSPLQQQLRNLADRLLYRERVNFRRVVQEFGHSLAQVIDLPELSHLILQRISDTLHLDTVSLYLFDPRSCTYQLFEAKGKVDRITQSTPSFAETDVFIQRLRVAGGAVYRHHHRPGWLNRLPDEEMVQVNHLRAIVFLPLVTKNRLVGWLNLGARLSGERYTSEDLDLLNALGDLAAVAVENARLFAERERRLTELAVLNEIGQAINSALSLEQVLKTIHKETGRLMDTTNFFIALCDEEKDEVHFPLFFENGQRIQPPPRRQGNGLTEYLLRTRQPLLIAERVEDRVRSLGLELIIIGRPATSWLGVPILHDSKPIGVLVVQSTQDDSVYDVEDLAILTAIANQAAIAIENARLYEMTDRALSRRLEENTVLTDFVRTLATVALEPSQVAEQTLNRIVQTLQAEQGILVHFDETEGTFTPLARRHWPSTEGWPEVWIDMLPQLYSAETGTLYCKPDDPLQQTFPGTASSPQLICPLIREDTVLAILQLILPAEVKLDTERHHFVRHLCNHAAIALENALLYQQQVEQRETLDRRAQHLAEILNLSNALRANMELDQVLHFVVEAARNTLGFRIALLSLIDEKDPDRVRRVAAGGLEPEVFRRLQTRTPTLGFYQQVMKPELRISHSYLICPEKTGIWDEIERDGAGYVPDLGPRNANEWNEQCALFTPLRGADDQLLGILSVDDPVDRQIPNRNTIEILEIFANQAAVAIENARLYQALHEANEAKGEFLSIVAHELRVPMGAIWGYADLLDREPAFRGSETQHGFVQVIKANIARLESLVNDLLDVSRIEAGEASIEPKPLDPQEIVMESVATFRPQIERKGLTLDLQVPEDLPPILADRDRMAQILDNILSNALKYTPPPGEITIAARLLRGIEQLNGSGPDRGTVHCPCILIQVQDSGIGLSQQEKKRLFTRFFRSDHPSVRQEEGTGLGLYLVHLLVEAHNGQVWVESEPGRGSTFSIAIPTTRLAGGFAQS
jgi:signal transduction histidine kinase